MKPLRTEISLLIFGLFLFLLLLEAALRLAGFAFWSLQEYRNLQSMRQKGTRRIMCVGESTTAGQYPPFLEEILNQRSGIKFSVIDKGVVGTTTSVILAELEANLDRYRPDMVVAMMGINDWGPHIPYEAATASKAALFFRSLRTYKLARLLWLHIVTKTREAAGTPSYIAQGMCYRSQGKFAQAEEAFRKALEADPKNRDAYLILGHLYREQSKFSQSEEAFKKVIALNYQDDGLYIGLGWTYEGQGSFAQAEEAFRKAIELNPQNEGAYIGLGWSYRQQGKFSRAEDAFKKAVELSPKNDGAYVELGLSYRAEGKISQAEGSYRKAIELNSYNDRAYAALAVVYEETGRPALAKEYAKKAEELRYAYYDPRTAANYRKLKEILDKRGIRFVCAQYPMRSIGPLRRIFKDQEGTIFFVDNEKIFRDAVKKDGYNAYFVDMLGGDFGHCTPKGNRLLAENIADAVMQGSCVHKTP
ncbi:MAG TPA: tetratricopeptide repeat protein [Patescibacteria group bacterium]|nr:tetratricopeptide repeat protein [Patescibacteria group bacterium]